MRNFPVFVSSLVHIVMPLLRLIFNNFIILVVVAESIFPIIASLYKNENSSEQADLPIILFSKLSTIDFLYLNKSFLNISSKDLRRFV